jgi:hypothetical protein
MLKIALRTATVAIGFMAVPALADTVTCESSNGRERYCAIDTRGGVVLTTQLSSSGCYQGETWGYDRRGVWVSGGCRAVFRSGGYNGSNWHSSNDYYDGDRNNRKNDGAGAAVAIGAILGAAIIASAASKNKNSGNGDYSRNYDSGCNYGRQDSRAGKSRVYDRHDSAYDSRGEQAFAAGYNQCYGQR